MNILIVGSKGFLGKELYDILSKKYDVTGLSRDNFDLLNLENLKIFFLDKHFDIVINCACKDFENSNDILRENLQIFENLCLFKENYKFFINFGSGAEFNRELNIPNENNSIPTDNFGLSKYIINKRIESLDRFLNLRLYNCFSKNEPDNKFIKSNLRNYLNHIPMIISQNMIADFFSIHDLITVIEYCIENYEKIDFKSLDLCYDEKLSLSDICTYFNTLLAHQVEIQIQNEEMKNTYSGNHTKLYELGLKLLGFKKSIQKNFEYDIGKKFWIETKFPIAFDSPDHLVPKGTANDNHHCMDLVKELEGKIGSRLYFLDLGCSGGGLVKDFVDEGYIALGLEGSDYSVVHQRAEWPELFQKNLFTCDISKPYNIYLYDSKEINQVLFNVISSWEVIEHIHPNALDTFFNNVFKHLSNDGIFIGSISFKSEVIEGVELHQSIFSEEDWKIKMSKYFNVGSYELTHRLREDSQSFLFQATKKV